MIDVRHLILSCVLACSMGCATTADDTVRPGKNGATIASSTEAGAESARDSAKTTIVMEETAIAGKNVAGDRVYCRRRAPIGSRVPVTKCVTEEQRRKQSEYTREIFKNQDLRR